MRLARVATPDGVAFVSLSSPSDADPAGVIAREIDQHPFGTPTFTGRTWNLADIRLLAPILATKVVAVGKNYAAHAAEMADLTGDGNPVPPADPVIFIKPSTTIIGPNAPILRPPASERVDFEGELAVVIGRPCRDVKAAQAKSAILGYTIANDVTARDIQRADGQWTRGKSYDSFCPLGPFIETELDPADLRITTRVNGELKQDSRTSLLVHPIEDLIEWVSSVMTLLPGDVILTGTPAGVGPLVAGDSVSVAIDGLGELTNSVADRS